MNKKEFLILAVASAILILLWISFDIIHSRASVRVETSTEEALEPLDPSFDQSTLQSISQITLPPTQQDIFQAPPPSSPSALP